MSRNGLAPQIKFDIRKVLVQIERGAKQTLLLFSMVDADIDYSTGRCRFPDDELAIIPKLVIEDALPTNF